VIRRAQPRDIHALLVLAQRATLRVETGNVVISLERMAAVALRMLSEPQSLVLVHETSDGIRGAIAVGVNDALWFDRKVASIVLWYAEVPGTGYAMLRHALEWCDRRPVIKAVGISEDFAWDNQLIGKILERAGLKRRGSVYARY
jgi:hypothetical protein